MSRTTASARPFVAPSSPSLPLERLAFKHSHKARTFKGVFQQYWPQAVGQRRRPNCPSAVIQANSVNAPDAKGLEPHPERCSISASSSASCPKLMARHQSLWEDRAILVGKRTGNRHVWALLDYRPFQGYEP